jgi:hypothetical protein
VFDAESYQSHVGAQSFLDALATIEQLSQENVSVTIHMPVNRDTVSGLPDFIDYARDQSCRVLLHYHKKRIPRAMRRAIHYFERYHWVRVLPLKRAYPEFCCTVPVLDPGYGFACAMSQGRAFLRRMQTFFQV